MYARCTVADSEEVEGRVHSDGPGRWQEKGIEVRLDTGTLTIQADPEQLDQTLDTLEEAVAELKLPRPDPAKLEDGVRALHQLVDASGLRDVARLFELLHVVERALRLTQASDGRAFLAPYVQAMVLDLERAVHALMHSEPVTPHVEHARALEQVIERWQPEHLVTLDAHSGMPAMQVGSLLSTRQLADIVRYLPARRDGHTTLHGSTTGQAAHRCGPEGQADRHTSIGDVLSTADVLLTSLEAMPSRLELLDALHVCTQSIVDMTSGMPEPLPRVVSAAADLVADCRARLAPPDREAAEYLRTLWVMTSLLLSTATPPPALVSAVDRLLGHAPHTGANRNGRHPGHTGHAWQPSLTANGS